MKTFVKIIATLESWLRAPRAPWLIVVLAALLVAPSLTSGRGSDDFVRIAAQEHADIALGKAPVDLFAFASGNQADAERLRAEGVFPWWADDTTKLHFFRPLASLSHSVDHALWPDQPVLEHAQSVLWYLLLLGSLWLMLRRSLAPRWLSAFALLVYAISSGHGGAIGWVASRNSIMAAVFGFLALWAHDRWVRDGWRAGAVVASLLYALAMGSAEGGVATLGYLVAHAAFLAEGGWMKRGRCLLPYAVITLGFGAISAIGSFGARHATQYIDPAGEPARYAAALVARLPIYLHSMLGGPPSDAWAVYPMVGPELPYLMWALAMLTIVGFVWLLRPILRQDRESLFWLVGAVLATAPACAGFPSDRLLLFGSAGFLVVSARYFVAVARDSNTLYPTRGKRALARGFAVVLFIALVPISAFGLQARARGTQDAQRPFGLADASLPSDQEITGKTLVLINPPLEPLNFYMQYARAARGAARPGRTRVLAAGSRELVVERVDARSLRVSSDTGLLSRTADMMMRSPARDLPAGANIELPGLHVEVERVTADGRPAAALFRFEQSLDDPGLVWMQWGKAGFTAFTPPAPGQTTRLAAVNLFELFTEKP